MRLSKLLFLWLLDVLGINAICRLVNRHKAIILMYHGVCDDGFNLTDRHIPKSMFHKQLTYLVQKGYVFLNMSELLTSIKNNKGLEKAVVLTFDDGFKNIADNAYPVMREFGAKGCFFLVSDLIGTNELLWTDYVETVIRNKRSRYFQFVFRGEKVVYPIGNRKSEEYAMNDIKAKLRTIPDKERLEHLKQFGNCQLKNTPEEFKMVNWEQINRLDPDILEIGCHTRSHPNCVNLVTSDELEDEIRNSKIDIENKIGHEVEHFCYPAGSYDERVLAKVRECYYKSAVTIEHGFTDNNSDVYKLKRIESSQDFLLFEASISGSYHATRKAKAILKSFLTGSKGNDKSSL